MNIWLKLRKTAAITLCELLAIATIFTGCASADLSGTEGAGHAAGAEVAGEDSSGALGSKDNADGPQEDIVNNNLMFHLMRFLHMMARHTWLSTIMSLFLRTAI